MLGSFLFSLRIVKSEFFKTLWNLPKKNLKTFILNGSKKDFKKLQKIIQPSFKLANFWYFILIGFQRQFSHNDYQKVFFLQTLNFIKTLKLLRGLK
jgi:hypothetical protein